MKSKLNIRKLLQPFWGIRPWARHSQILMVAGFIYIVVGISYIKIPATPARAESLHVALTWFSFPTWGAIWIAVGVLSIISSRWPPISETWGYTVLTGLAAAWAAFYFTGILFGFGSLSSVSSVCVWGLVAYLWWAISGLVNPPRIIVVRHGTN